MHRLQIHVVDEERLYPEWGAAGAGATAARRVLNELHARLARGGYCELYVDQVDRDVTALTRHHPATRQVGSAQRAARPPGARRLLRAVRGPGGPRRHRPHQAPPRHPPVGDPDGIHCVLTARPELRTA
ncbi:hypothetical protein ACJJTC_018686 [Scirpophaga incertulas]